MDIVLFLNKNKNSNGKNWKQLIDADIEPHNYQPKSENSENKSKNIEIVQEEKDLDLSI